MKPHSIGRAMGIGLRIAGRIAGQHVAASASTASGSAGNAPARPAVTHAQGRAAGQAAGGVARGIGGFLRPFRRVGSIVWLEVMGVFFFLFVLVFGQALWRTRASYAHSQDALGKDHGTFLLSAAFMLIFLYLSLSSFWRARRK
jgi:hypothetical protein